MPMNNTLLCVPRHSSGQDPHAALLLDVPLPSEIPQNHIVIHIDRFGFSANNVTYQALGEHPHFRYFDFHSAPKTDKISPKTHGLVPVWSFGTVTRSTHHTISVGERVYGYFAPVMYLLVPVSETDVNTYSFYVPRPHLPADRRPYNQIIRCAVDPQYSPNPFDEDLTMLYRPLYWTSYWFEDWIFSSQYRGANTILISSASSKTAFCVAYRITQRCRKGDVDTQPKIIGLTSTGNIPFTRGLGLYDEIIGYGDFSSSSSSLGMPRDKILYVDVAGNSQLNRDIFTHSAKDDTPDIVGAIQLGMTNLSPQSSPSALPGGSWDTNNFASAPTNITTVDKMEQFFMVEWLNVRKHQLKPGEIFRLQLEAWQELMRDGKSWVKIERVYGATAVRAAYMKIARGGLGPEKGFIWSLWETEAAATISPLLPPVSKL